VNLAERTMRVLLSTYFIIVGLWFVIGNSKLSQQTVDWYLNVFGFQYNKELYRRVFLVGGILSVTVAVLTH
jgi:hypothetical protein